MITDIQGHQEMAAVMLTYNGNKFSIDIKAATIDIIILFFTPAQRLQIIICLLLYILQATTIYTDA